MMGRDEKNKSDTANWLRLHQETLIPKEFVYVLRQRIPAIRSAFFSRPI